MRVASFLLAFALGLASAQGQPQTPPAPLLVAEGGCGMVVSGTAPASVVLRLAGFSGRVVGEDRPVTLRSGCVSGQQLIEQVIYQAGFQKCDDGRVGVAPRCFEGRAVRLQLERVGTSSRAFDLGKFLDAIVAGFSASWRGGVLSFSDSLPSEVYRQTVLDADVFLADESTVKIGEWTVSLKCAVNTCNFTLAGPSVSLPVLVPLGQAVAFRVGLRELDANDTLVVAIAPRE